MDDKRKIKFEELFERGIKKEKNISDSFFFDVYAQAYDLVDEIILKNERIEATLECNSDCFLMPQSVTDINNVIAFTGRRGTGKTSAMLSFSDFLMNNQSMGRYDFKNKYFLTLPYIDSATMNTGEDFFDIIISKMLKIIYNISDSCNCYRNYDDNNIEKIEELKSDIANVYSYYSSLKYEKIRESIPSYSVMEKVMQKHDVRSKVIDVIKKFNNVVGTVHKGRPYDYMVICLDDIDMVRKGHVEIMQLIYQYFMIPGVIVMVTFNTEYLTAIIEKEFYSNIEFANGTNNKSQRNLDISQNQTYDFLRKIIPSDMRITMPSWKKSELRSLFPVNIELSENFGNFNRLTEEFKNAINDLYKKKQSKSKYLTPKEVIMLFLADRTHCYLDSKGYKLHFIEPDSLRNLYDIFYLLYEMKPVEEKNDHVSLEYNRKILLNYLHFRMIPGYNLSYRVSQHIEKLESVTMERRGRRIWENYYQRLFEKENDIKELYGGEFIKGERKRHFVENYNFGEVFRCLYFGSRLELFDKNYVKAVLASYAFAMPQFVESQKQNRIKHHDRLTSDNKSDNQNILENSDILYRFDELRYVFGYSMIGEWQSNLFNDRNVIIAINKNIFERGDRKENIKHFIYLLLLSNHSGSKYIKYEKFDNGSNSQYRIYTTLDPTAFIMGTIRVHRITKFRFSHDSIHGIDLKDLIAEILNKNEKDEREDISKDVSDIIKEIYGEKYFSLEDIENGQDANEFIWFLLKNIDITYNVIKRTVKSFLYFSDENLNCRVTEGTPFEVMKKFYKKFIKHFEDTIKIYKGYKKIKNISESYNPIIEWFGGSDSYGKYCCILDNNDNDKHFYQYGCGMEYDYPALNSFEQFIKSLNFDNIESLYNYLCESINSTYLKTKIAPEKENRILEIIKNHKFSIGNDYKIIATKIINILEQGIFREFGTFLEYILDKEDYNEVKEEIQKIQKDNLLKIKIPELIQREVEKYINQDYSIDKICEIVDNYNKEILKHKENLKPEE